MFQQPSLQISANLIGLGAADLELKMYVQVRLAYFLLLRNQRNNKIRRHPSVMRISHQGRQRRGINFLYNNRTVTVNMERVHVQISCDGVQ